MEPTKFGNTHDIVKKSMLADLLKDQGTIFYHPMYFQGKGEIRDYTFTCRSADFLGIRLLHEDLTRRDRVADAAVSGSPGHIFLDPNAGLTLKSTVRRDTISAKDLIDITQSANRRGKLVIVYDKSITRNGDPARNQVIDKLRHLSEEGVHCAAYVSHIAVVWMSSDPQVVQDATNRLLSESGLPECCIVVPDSTPLPIW